MEYQKNMTGWNQALIDQGIKSDSENRLNGLMNLIESGLPTYRYHFFTLDEFINNSKEVYLKYNSVVVRAIPKITGPLARFTRISESLDDTINFLMKEINPVDKSKYTIVVNEYDPAEYCGVIISNNKKLTIEMVKEPNLEKLCHGQSIPWSAFFTENYSFRKMDYLNVNNETIKQKMWQVIKSISDVYYNSNIPQYDPKKGYFEFVLSKKKGIRFIDYKKSF
jgi:hypothetical protein